MRLCYATLGAEQNSFAKAKEALQNSSLQMHFDDEEEVVLACDASSYGLTAVLLHKTENSDHQIASTSRYLTKAKKTTVTSKKRH